MIQHPAFNVSFSNLIEGLENECILGNVNKRTNGNLTQWTYTQQCTYTGAWNLFTKIARGIIVDHERIVALPFPKFFGIKENKTEIPDLPFECYEKVDGSLIIVYHYNGRWETATKGSFNSDQAIAARKFLLENRNILDSLRYNNTYLFEYVGPTNKIVVNYTKEDLILLGVYCNIDGEELDPESYLYYNFDVAMKYSFFDLDSIIEKATILSKNEEGYVLRYTDGTRVKIKGDEYCRVHKLLSNITPLAIWEMMMHGDNLEFIRRELPEEFLIDFNNIVKIIETDVYSSIKKTREIFKQTNHLTDKNLGLILHTLDSDVRKLIFPYRKNNGKLLEDKRCREALFRLYRPTRNVLPGYNQSGSMNRIQNDD